MPDKDYCSTCNRDHCLKPGIHRSECKVNVPEGHLGDWQRGWDDHNLFLGSDTNQLDLSVERVPQDPNNEYYMKGWDCCSNSLVPWGV